MGDPRIIESALKGLAPGPAGIDYGMGTSNIDHNTGIRYGVISQNEVLQAWADSSEPDYGMPEENELPEDAEPMGFYLDDGKYEAYCGDDGDIFITKSPFFTFCKYCSPCAPGAGYLMNPIDGGAKTYCFDFSWFEGYNAPYPVYSVKTGKEITKEEFLNENNKGVVNQG